MNLSRAIFVSVLLFVFTGCGNQAIYNVSNQGIPPVSKVKNIDEMKKAIYAACLGRGWKVQDISNGVIIATIISNNNNSATVEIKYDAKNYSITYKESAELESDGKTIHDRYNRWIKNLDNDIQKNLALM